MDISKGGSGDFNVSVDLGTREILQYKRGQCVLRTGTSLVPRKPSPPGLHLKEHPPEGSGPKIREDRISDQDACKCLGSFILIFTREQIYYLKR